MKFLVILICLAVNYLWSKHSDRFDDSWISHISRLADLTFSRFDRNRKLPWIAPIVSVYVFVLLLLFVLLQLASDFLFGFATMLVHICVLLVALDRTQPGKLVSEFLRRWLHGDSQAILNFLREKGLNTEERDFQSDSELLNFFKEQVIYRCFENIFVMVFSYLLAGAFGVLFAYASYRLRSIYEENHHIERVKLIDKMILVLEWFPVRLLALTFSLVGNFVLCFDKLQPRLVDFNQRSNSADLYEYAVCAASEMAVFNSKIDERSLVDLDPAVDETECAAHAGDLEAVQALLERSQAIWLAGLALLTLVNLQIF